MRNRGCSVEFSASAALGMHDRVSMSCRLTDTGDYPALKRLVAQFQTFEQGDERRGKRK
jgi:hypothetical protein